MTTPQLNETQRDLALEILTEVRERLTAASGGDRELLFALRRKVQKELMHDERSKPGQRNRVKALKRTEQGGLCPLCHEPLPDSNAVLERFEAVEGYTVANTRLIHAECDRRVEMERGAA